MKVNESKSGQIIQHKADSDLWGIATCLSDDETTVYYKPRGMPGIRLAAHIDDVELGNSNAIKES